MATRTATVASTKRRTRKRPWVRFFKRFTLFVLTVACIGFIVGAAMFASEYKQAQQKLSNLPVLMSQLELQPTTFYSADGKPLYVISNEYRLPAKFKDIPKVMLDATVAAEDVRFYHHHGVDFPSLVRIAVEAMKEKKLGAGGSTLTMQLAKRLYTSPERSLKRKVQDMALAVAMERELTKEQILELYLNQVFFGSSAYGIKAAAEIYLGKPLDRLDASDAALLIRCVRRPGDETPFSNLKKSIENRNAVLGVMRDEGMITEAVYKHSIKEKPRLNPKPPATTARLLRAPYFVDHVRQILKQDLPADIDITRGGYKIYTTLDSRLEAEAEKQVKKAVQDFKGYRVNTGACVVMDAKGRILAEVGGYDYKRNQFNVIWQGRRQPGSSFKSFLYSASIAQGITTADGSVSNERYYERDPWTGKVWSPANDNGRYGGYISTKTAFAWSYNVCAVRLLLALGPNALVDYAHNVFGFTSEIPAVKSLALGTCEVSPLEMARGYSVFMTGGDRVEPHAIDRIVGPDGQIVRKYEPQIAANVLDPRVVNQMRELQRAVVEFGTGMTAKAVPNARGKTGTTQDNKDAWFCGYSDGIVCISWVSNEQRDGNRWIYKPMSSRAFGGTTAIHIWTPVMKMAHDRFAVVMNDRQPPNTNTDAPFANEQDVKPSQDTSESTHVDEMANPPTTPDPAVQDPSDSDTNGNDQPSDVPDPDSGDTETPPAKPVVVKKPKPAPPPVQYVDVEICADSHELATMYCPETVVRTYQKGKEPTRRCHIHGPH